MIEKEISKRMKEGVMIDAHPRISIMLAFKVLDKEGYNPRTDRIDYCTDYQDQFTRVKYLKTSREIDEETGKEYLSRHYVMSMPDKYVPAKETPQGVVRSMEDIK